MTPCDCTATRVAIVLDGEALQCPRCQHDLGAHDDHGCHAEQA